MNLKAFLTCNGLPRTGLTPTITIYEIGNPDVLVVNGDTMTEIGSGLYKYEFASHDPSKEYVTLVDAGSNIHPHERFHTEDIPRSVWAESLSSNNIPGSMGSAINVVSDIDMMVNTLLDYAENRTFIDPVNNTMTIYADDGVTPIKIFNLKDENGQPSITCVFERVPQ